MPAAKPVDLCQFDLPNGKLCRQVALKDQYVCRHHMRNFRQAAHDCSVQEAIERFTARLNQMDLPDVLLFLEQKLRRIQTAIPAFREARITLEVAIERLKKQNDQEATLLEYAQRHPLPDMNSPEFQQLLEKLDWPMS